jgi:hypothetical protein
MKFKLVLQLGKEIGGIALFASIYLVPQYLSLRPIQNSFSNERVIYEQVVEEEEEEEKLTQVDLDRIAEKT